MDQGAILTISVFVALAVGAGLVALGVWGLPKLRSEEQGYPLEAQVEEALLPLAFEGICSAYRLSEWAMDELDTRLDGLNKKQMADAIYDLIPEEVAGFPVGLIKNVVPRHRFQELVQDAFARFDRDFVGFQGRYEALFDEWRQAYMATDASKAETEAVDFFREG